MFDNLLWILYAAEVIPGAGTLSFVVLLVILVVYAIAIFCYLIDKDKFLVLNWKAYIVMAFLAAITVLTPSKQFFYIAAGAKAAEAGIQSKIGQKTIQLVEQKIDEVLEKKEEKKK